MQFLKLISISLLLLNPFNLLAQDNNYSAEEIMMKMEIALKEIIKTHQIKEIPTDDRNNRNLFSEETLKIERHPLNYLPSKMLSNAEYIEQKRFNEYIELIKQDFPFESHLSFKALEKDEKQENIINN